MKDKKHEKSKLYCSVVCILMTAVTVFIFSILGVANEKYSVKVASIVSPSNSSLASVMTSPATGPIFIDRSASTFIGPLTCEGVPVVTSLGAADVSVDGLWLVNIDGPILVRRLGDCVCTRLGSADDPIDGT